MNIETERKFLVKNDNYKKEASVVHRIEQGYIVHDTGRTVRVRISDNTGYLTIKGPSENGISRLEWEMEIPLSEAESLMQLCKNGIIDKSRYIIPAGKARFFEVDEFYGDNKGLVIAEIELGTEDETFKKPEWLGEEVTGDHRYYNSSLCIRPYKDWGK